MLNYAIAFTFKLIILIMLVYILNYIVNYIYIELFPYPKIIEEEQKKEKLIEEETVKLLTLTLMAV